MARNRRGSHSAPTTAMLEPDSHHRAARLAAIRDRVLKSWDYLDATDNFLVENPNFGPLQGLGGIKKDLLRVADALNQVDVASSYAMSLPGTSLDSHPMRLLAAAAQEIALAQKSIGFERKDYSWQHLTTRRILRAAQRTLRSCRNRVEQLLQDLPLLAAYGIGNTASDSGTKGIAPDAVSPAAANNTASAQAPAATAAPTNAVTAQQYTVNQAAGKAATSSQAAAAPTQQAQPADRPQNTR